MTLTRSDDLESISGDELTETGVCRNEPKEDGHRMSEGLLVPRTDETYEKTEIGTNDTLGVYELFTAYSFSSLGIERVQVSIVHSFNSELGTNSLKTQVLWCDIDLHQQGKGRCNSQVSR